MKHTVLSRKFTDLQKARCRADITVSLLLVKVVDFALERVTAIIAVDVFSNDPLRRTAEVSKLQM